MIASIKCDESLLPFLTDIHLENGVGVVIDSGISADCRASINVDKYYHSLHLAYTPEIVDLLIAIRSDPLLPECSIFVVEMKNISKPKYFSAQNIYNKFQTAIDDFMKSRYAHIFENRAHAISRFRLLFVSDAYNMLSKGFSQAQIRSFLQDTKIATLQNMPPFKFREFNAVIEYELPNPLVS